MWTLYKKELSYYFNNPVGYIILVLFGLFANFVYVKDIFVVGSASMRPFFSVLPWLFLIFIPALSMRTLSEEKRTNTIETLLTLPVSETQIVMAKFLALLTLSAIALVLTLGLPVSVSMLTRLYLPEIFVGYLGALLMAALYVSISMFFSAQTKNQVVAFLLSILVLFLLNVMSTDFVATVFPKLVLDALSYVTPVYHLENFIRGVLSLRSIIFFLSFTIAFLLLTIIDLEKRE